jgi:hypothetical protein
MVLCQHERTVFLKIDNVIRHATCIDVSSLCHVHKGNNKITELRTILQRESQNSYVYKETKSADNRQTVKTVMTLTWYRHF